MAVVTRHPFLVALLEPPPRALTREEAGRLGVVEENPMTPAEIQTDMDRRVVTFSTIRFLASIDRRRIELYTIALREPEGLTPRELSLLVRICNRLHRTLKPPATFPSPVPLLERLYTLQTSPTPSPTETLCLRVLSVLKQFDETEHTNLLEGNNFSLYTRIITWITLPKDDSMVSAMEALLDDLNLLRAISIIVETSLSTHREREKAILATLVGRIRLRHHIDVLKERARRCITQDHRDLELGPAIGGLSGLFERAIVKVLTEPVEKKSSPSSDGSPPPAPPLLPCASPSALPKPKSKDRRVHFPDDSIT
ncbi:MAG: hypothetical protein JSR76_07505 [Verrucomicrobia bacterium]|nr:hypothetical protein [Verrucomicrobiota bacterium]